MGLTVNAKILDDLLIFTAGLTIALIVWKGLALYVPLLWAKPKTLSARATEAQVAEWVEDLEAGLPLLATLAGAAPFVGLAATVLHIMQALRLLGGAAMDASVVAGPIATALNSTLLGLASAVPAVIAYNLLSRRIQVLENRARRLLSQAGDAAPGAADTQGSPWPFPVNPAPTTGAQG